MVDYKFHNPVYVSITVRTIQTVPACFQLDYLDTLWRISCSSAYHTRGSKETILNILLTFISSQLLLQSLLLMWDLIHWPKGLDSIFWFQLGFATLDHTKQSSCICDKYLRGTTCWAACVFCQRQLITNLVSYKSVRWAHPSSFHPI